MGARSGRLAVGVTLGLLALSGCAGSPARDHDDARARLDLVSGRIDLPLEAFAMSDEEVGIISEANALLVARCMDESGRDFPRAYQDWEAASTFPDRRYGLWMLAEAELHGYEVPEAADSAHVSALEDEFDDGWWRDVERCYGDVERLPLMGVNTSPEVVSPVDQGMSESFGALLASDTFADARSEWLDCIRAEGLERDEGSTVLVPQFPAAGEQQIRIATIDVTCKQHLNTVQRLADFETREQLAFIDQREADLREYRAEVDEVLERARAIIAEGAGGS